MFYASRKYSRSGGSKSIKAEKKTKMLSGMPKQEAVTNAIMSRFWSGVILV